MHLHSLLSLFCPAACLLLTSVWETTTRCSCIEYAGDSSEGRLKNITTPVSTMRTLCHMPAQNILNCFHELTLNSDSECISTNAPGYTININMPNPFIFTPSLKINKCWQYWTKHLRFSNLSKNCFNTFQIIFDKDFEESLENVSTITTVIYPYIKSPWN